MKIRLVVALIFCFSVALAAQEPTKPVTQNMVKGTGYVEAGVEAGCKVLKDAKTGVLYNLFFSSKDQPTLGTAITFEGTVHEGPTTCMEGKAVNVSSWTKMPTTEPEKKQIPPSQEKK